MGHWRLYRVVQEGVRNIEKHSRAREAQLALNYCDGLFELVIEDHGRGFEPARAGQMNGLELVSMKEKPRLMNGHFRVARARRRYVYTGSGARGICEWSNFKEDTQHRLKSNQAKGFTV